MRKMRMLLGSQGRYAKGKMNGWGMMRTADAHEYVGEWTARCAQTSVPQRCRDGRLKGF